MSWSDFEGRGDRMGRAQRDDEGRAGSVGPITPELGDESEIRVPMAEERLEVEKREAEMGEVRLHKTVTEEQVSVPVELEREEVHVSQRDVNERPVQAGDQVFQEGTIRVPIRGEEAVVSKEAVITGEVVLEKGQTVERQEITDTVRREQVEIDEDYQRHRGGFQQHFTDRQAQIQGRTGQGFARSWEQAEPNYRYGYGMASDEQYRGREFDDADPDLRRDYETRYGQVGSDRWQHLREEIREGWNRARGR